MASELFFVFISSKRLLTVDLDILVILDVRMSPTLSQDTFRKWGGGSNTISKAVAIFSPAQRYPTKAIYD